MEYGPISRIMEYSAEYFMVYMKINKINENGIFQKNGKTDKKKLFLGYKTIIFLSILEYEIFFGILKKAQDFLTKF